MGKLDRIRKAEPYHPPPPPRHYFEGDERSEEVKTFLADLAQFCQMRGFLIWAASEGDLIVSQKPDADYRDIAQATEYRP